MAIRYDVSDRVAAIVIDRPGAKNALDQDRLDALAAALREAARDEDAWCVRIAATGADFCVGQDVKELSAGTRKGGDYFAPVFRALKALYKPVICSVRGLCLAGGAGIAMGSDIRILSETARFGWPHTKIGIASIGGPSTLARAIPVNLALELMFTGDFLPADRARDLGLANHVVPDGELEAFTDGIVEKVMRNAPLALRAAKEATLTTVDRPYDEAVSAARAILDRLIETEDAQEGMRAFVEKRPPVWRAR